MNKIGMSLASLVFWGMSAPCPAQDFRGAEVSAAMAKIEQMRREGKPIPPAPRMPDGHPDLGNAAGSWFGPTLADMSGHGQGTSSLVPGLPPGEAMPEGVAEVAFLPWAKKIYDERQANIAKDDPEVLCVPPGIPRANGIAFPFQIYQHPDRIVFGAVAHRGRCHARDTGLSRAALTLSGSRRRPRGRRRPRCCRGGTPAGPPPPAHSTNSSATTTRSQDHSTGASPAKTSPNYSLASAPPPKVIVIPAQSDPSDAVIAWLRNATQTTDVTMSVCTGAFLLAKTGLLSGKTVTTHHAAYAELAMAFPDIFVKRGARFVESGNLASSGGLSSGIDLALRVVERYFGREVAKSTAYQMEYQGQGWMNPSSNADYAVGRVSTDAHPLCPVCDMEVDPKLSPKSVHLGKTYYFCSASHKAQFDASPDRFVKALGQP
jgi:putative intracellular protease/amidase/YHS domain-containing protein